MDKSNIKKLERVRYRATEIVKGWEHMAYKDKWKELG